MAGRYAEVLELHGDPGRGKVTGATMADARRGHVQRRAPVEDLTDRIQIVREAAAEAGRFRDAVRVATQIWYTAFGSPRHVRSAEEELCTSWARFELLDTGPRSTIQRATLRGADAWATAPIAAHCES
jgi:hypothetical protein